MTPEIAARLDSLNIQYSINGRGYGMFVRGNLLVMALWQNGRFTAPGSAGIMTDNGLSYLLWREGKPVLVSHGGIETAATAEQVESIRRMSEDVKAALGVNE